LEVVPARLAVLVLALALALLPANACAAVVYEKQVYAENAWHVAVKLGTADGRIRVLVDGVPMSGWVDVSDKDNTTVFIALKQPLNGWTNVKIDADGYVEVLDFYVGGCIELPYVGRVCIGQDPREIQQQMQEMHERHMQQMQEIVAAMGAQQQQQIQSLVAAQHQMMMYMVVGLLGLGALLMIAMFMRR